MACGSASCRGNVQPLLTSGLMPVSAMWWSTNFGAFYAPQPCRGALGKMACRMALMKRTLVSALKKLIWFKRSTSMRACTADTGAR